jgi:hypothetical protein
MRRLFILAAVLVVLAGCRADVAVDVTVEPDGSGTVTVTVDVDAEVVAQTVDLPTQLRTADLEAAGWTVAEPEPLDGGGMRLTATKEVPSAEQFGAVLAEIHPDLFPTGELEVRRTFGTTRYLWTSTIDRTVTVDVFGDESVAPLLDGFLFGVAPEELVTRAGGPLEDAVTVAMTVTLPDGTMVASEAAPLGAESPDELRRSMTIVDDEAIEERDREERLRSAVPLVVAIGAVIWAAVAGGLWWWRRRH